MEGLAGIKNVIHQQHIAVSRFEAQFFGKDQFARSGAVAVTGYAHEIQP